jgi:hypothetical protein
MGRAHKPDKQASERSQEGINDILAALEAYLPAMLEQLADLFGKGSPRISVTDKRQLMVRLRRKLRGQWSKFADLESLGAEAESAERTAGIKTGLREILIEMIAPPRIRKLSVVEQMDWLIAMAAKATNAPRAAWARQAPYLEARAHLWNTLINTYKQVQTAAVQAAIREWVDDGEHSRYIHSLRLLTVAATRFRSRPTQRISDRAAVELQNEYQRSANLFEQQLRLLTCLVRQGKQTAKPWSYWQGQNLRRTPETCIISQSKRPECPHARPTDHRAQHEAV